MRPTSITVTTSAATGQSAWIPVDYTQTPFNLGIMVDVTAGTPSWVVQMTMDDPFDSTITPTAVAAPSPLEAGTTDEVGNITIPCRAVRLYHASSTGTSVMTVIQGRNR